MFCIFIAKLAVSLEALRPWNKLKTRWRDNFSVRDFVFLLAWLGIPLQELKEVAPEREVLLSLQSGPREAGENGCMPINGACTNSLVDTQL